MVPAEGEKRPQRTFRLESTPCQLGLIAFWVAYCGGSAARPSFQQSYIVLTRKKRQIKNLQGSLHHWPVTGALRELIFHGSICLGAKILIKMYFVHVKKDCFFQIYLTAIKLCLLLLGSCVSRWHSSWDIGPELLFFEDYLHLGSGLWVKSKSYDLSF